LTVVRSSPPPFDKTNCALDYDSPLGFAVILSSSWGKAMLWVDFRGSFFDGTELIKRSLRLDDEPKWWCREPSHLCSPGGPPPFQHMGHRDGDPFRRGKCDSISACQASARGPLPVTKGSADPGDRSVRIYYNPDQRQTRLVRICPSSAYFESIRWRSTCDHPVAH